jgi:DNA repair exonuclease SbcCD ATPase subunit
MNAQTRIGELEPQIPPLETQETEYNNIIALGYVALEEWRPEKVRHTNQLNQYKMELATQENKLAGHQKLINSLSKMKGCQCPTCYGIVQEENYALVIDNAKEEIAKCDIEIGQIKKKMESRRDSIRDVEATISQYEKGVADVKGMIATTRAELKTLRDEIAKLSKIKKPEVGVDEQIIVQQIEDLKQRAVLKEEEIKGPSPYVEIAKIADQDVETKRQTCQEKKDELTEAEDDIPHWEFLIDAYDTEIRKFVIADIIPTLNVKIQYWLQFLIDGKIDCKFNNALDETIHRAPYNRGNSAYVYNALSGGQRRRLNLAISQAFAHIMTLSSEVMPSLVFLDEVDLNVDVHGIMGIYKMIQELARDKQVFITTHSKELMEMLDDGDSLNLVMQNGFTKMLPRIDSKG